MTFTWFDYAVASTLFTAAFWLLCRRLLKDEADHEIFAIFMQLVPIVFWLPLLAFEPVRLPSVDVGWLFVVLAGSAWALQQVMAFKSLRFTAASIREPIYQTKLLWAALFAFLLVAEGFTPSKWAGFVFLLAGALVIAYRHPPGESSPQGVALVVSSAALTGLAYVLDKLALSHFSVTSYAILVSVLSGGFIALHAARHGLLRRLAFFGRRHVKTILLASLMGAVSYWLQIKAVSLGPVGTIAALLELSMVFTTLGGIVLLQERQAVGRKLVGIGLAVVGALMLRGFFPA
ncbi:EamA family transporter [Candidatus Micrarchaeota archaeon]|nr:EamA family transporter [Candidatus Micrarchaeota archaeon]